MGRISQIPTAVGEKVGTTDGLKLGLSVATQLSHNAGQWVFNPRLSAQFAARNTRQISGSGTPWHWVAVGRCVGPSVGRGDGASVGEPVG